MYELENMKTSLFVSVISVTQVGRDQSQATKGVSVQLPDAPFAAGFSC